MAGLLDFMSTPEGQGLLSAAFGGLAGARRGQPLNSLGRAGLAGLSGFSSAIDRQTEAEQLKKKNALYDLQLKQATQAQADQERARMQEEAFRKLIPDPGFQASQAALAGGGGPTMANAQQVRPVDPQQQMLFNAMSTGQIKPMEYITATQKDRTPIKLGKDDRLLEPGTNRVLVDAAPDPSKDTSPGDWKLYQLSGAPQRGLSFDQWDLTRRRANATSVSVNTDSLGLKPKDRFEMEQKLGADYSAATKLDSGIVSTAQDIRNILQQGGALKDQAAIYKFAKALDPDGAVREADYDAIVKTAGGLDYVKALFNKALTGEQLAPKQRTEMINLTNAMAAVAQQRIAKAQARFGGNARLYNLNPENVFQVPSNDGWSIEK